MSVTDLPSKLIESASNLTEKKIEVACQLLTIIHANKDKNLSVGDLLSDYSQILDFLKTITPADTSTVAASTKSLFYLISAIIIALIVGGLFWWDPHFISHFLQTKM